MARGVRSTPTLLPLFSQQNQPQSLSSYDPLTRRNVILTYQIVPNLRDGTAVDLAIPADRFYANLGAAPSNSYLPAWLGSTSSSATFQQWDSSQKVQYMRLANAGGSQLGSVIVPAFIYPLGPFGRNSSFTPKNTSAVRVRIQFTARFNANADYGTRGIGGNNADAADFATSTDHFIQLTRNTGNFELGTCDGSTISQDTSAAADGGWHEHDIKWSATEIVHEVDGAAGVTKTTNLPTKPLCFVANAQDATNTVDISEILITWEVT